jgi:hypothetical protein
LLDVDTLGLKLLFPKACQLTLVDVY